MNWLPIIIVSVQATLVAAVGLLAGRMLRSAAHRHSVLFAALLCILASPLFYAAAAWTGVSIKLPGVFPPPLEAAATALLPLDSAPIGQEVAPLASPAASGQSPETAVPDSSAPVAATPLAPVAAIGKQHDQLHRFPLRANHVVAGLWLAGTLLSLAGVLRAHWKTKCILRAARPVAQGIEASVIAESERRLNAARRLRVATSGKVAGPAVVGVFRPAILIPGRYLETLSRDELLQILIHEGAHALRRDPLAALLQRIGGALFWWHPLVHLVNRDLTLAREEVCDNFVLTHTEPVKYGATLLRLATLSPAMAQMALAIGMFDGRGTLEERIRGLLDTRRKIKTHVRFVTAATMLGALALLSAAVGATRVGAENSPDAPKFAAKEAQAAPAEALMPVVEIADSEYTRPTAKDRRATAMIPAEAWGKPVDGLRVAIILKSPPVDKHDRLVCDIVAENVSEHDLRFLAKHDEWLNYSTTSLFDADGKQVAPQASAVSELLGPTWTRIWLKPKERIVISSWGAGFLKETEAGELTAPEAFRGWPHFRVKPGRYSLSATVELGQNLHSIDPISKRLTVLSPAKGERSRKLQTGVAAVELFTQPAPADEAAAMPPRDASLDVVAQIPDADYTRPTAADQRATAMIPAEAWGEPVDGMRVAIVLHSPPIDKHERLVYDIVAENVSDGDIRFGAFFNINEWLNYCQTNLLDAEGKQIPQQVGGVSYLGASLKRMWLKPKERGVISSGAAMLFKQDEAGRARSKEYHGPSYFIVKPGRYAVSAAVELGRSMHSVDPISKKRTVLSPAKGEWSGKLQTGAAAVELFTQPAAADEAAAKPPRDASLDVVAQIPDANYTRPTAADQRAAAMIPAEAWGESVDGLRAAIVLRSPPVDKDQRLSYDIVAENVSDHDIRFSARLGADHRQNYCQTNLFEAAGNQVARQDWSIFRQRPRLIRIWLKPKERIVISPWAAPLIRQDEAGQPLARPEAPRGPSYFSVKPGRYSVSADVALGSLGYSTDPTSGIRTVLSPAKGEWSGKVQTGTAAVALFSEELN